MSTRLAGRWGRARVSGCRCCGASPLPARGSGRHDGRGLCTSCRAGVVAAGQLDQYPRTTRSRREVVRQVVDLRTVEPGLSVAQLAGRLGMTYAALEIALRRARADGEPV